MLRFAKTPERGKMLNRGCVMGWKLQEVICEEIKAIYSVMHCRVDFMVWVPAWKPSNSFSYEPEGSDTLNSSCVVRFDQQALGFHHHHFPPAPHYC